MMQLLLAATVFTSCCLLQFKVTVGQSSDSKFTVVPPATVFGVLGSDVYFHWNFSFANSNDWSNFEEIYWGKTDNNERIRDKYLTVSKDGSVLINDILPPSIKSRLNVTKTINKHGCSVHFVLQSVTLSDELVTYGCTAMVEGDGYKEGPIRLVLRVAPKITRRSNATVDVEEGDDVKLLCNASGDPKPFIRWTKNGKLLQTSNTTTDFLIPKIERKDGGSYACTASNPAGSAFYSVYVRVVKYRPYINKITSSNPVVKSWLTHVTSLKCVVDANPAANFKWFKDGQLISSGINTTHGTSTLTLTPSTAGDFGQYSCKATNDKGTAWHNVTVEQLFVPGPPAINTLIPDILSISTAWSKPSDDGGSPILSYRITLLGVNKKKQQMLSGIKQNKYILQNLKHNRTYTLLLQAGNVVGYGKPANVTVSTLQAVPPRVLSVTAVPSLMAVNISWNSTNNNTGVMILDYRVLLIDTVTQQQQEFTGINVSKLYVPNLKHNRTYVIKVQARNEDGYGRFKSQSLTTLEADPPGPPTIKVFPRAFALELTWKSSVQDVNNIKILDYRIKVSDGAILKEEFSAITRKSFTIEKLARNKTYVIEIQARNEVGYGETTNISAVTLLVGPPDAPLITNITVDGKLCSLKWAKPYNGESPIEVYTVSIWKLQARNVLQRINAWNTTETKYSLDLEWNQNYTTAVSAWNIYGQSFNGVRHFSTGKFAHATIGTELGTEVLSTSPYMTEELSSTKDTETYRTEYPTVAKGANKEKEPTRNSFIYLAPLWVVVMAFAIPAVVFMLWKFTQKIILVHVCKRRSGSSRRRQLHNRDSESSATTIDDFQERTVTNHYETITEILEMHYNHGYTTEDEKGFKNEKLSSLPGYNVYNHLFETPLGSGLNLQQTPQMKKDIELINPNKQGQQKELKSGVGMFPNNVYSHLIHGDSLNNRQYGVNGTVTVLPKRKWEISRDRLKLEKTIGSGEFGVVKKGLALNVNKNGGWVRVAVKTLNDNGEENELCRKDLLSELKVMKSLSPHKHVVQLLACITESEPVCVITEFAPYGDLLGFLRKKRGLRDGYYSIDHLPRRSLTCQQLMQFASDIADGMAYLSSQKIIHRDLAARNVLLGEDLTCKVTDFGMARDICGQDMYQRNTGGRLPVKWTALEALLHGRYTTKSDVWSFGVVLFEIVTIGGSPYPDMEVLELIDKLESGYRMEKPRHVADEVYALMLSCWNEKPDKRPTFLQLYSILNQLATEKQGCVNLKTYDGRLYENFTPA